MNTVSISPYINFQGHAREALEFYQRVLGGELQLYAVDGQGSAHPAGPNERIQYAVLNTENATIVATDGHPNFPATVGEHMGLTLTGADKDEVNTLAHALAEGGVLKSSLVRQPWGGEAAWLTDRFGINWMVQLIQA